MSKTRPATPTVAFIDEYCARYRSLFHNVRHFEQFTALHLGLLAETRRKSLPRLGKTVHMDPQALHHFLANAGWSVKALRQRRLELLRQAVGTTPFILCIDETGDRKKGHTTDYVATQYIGNLHTLANGIVSVNAYGVLDTTTFPLLFRIFKPQTRLTEGDVYKTKPQLAIEIIEELLRLGFRFSVVLADSLYGDSGPFISALHRLRLQYVVAIRSNHGAWMLPGQRIRQTRWRPFERIFTDGTSQARFIRETVFGTRRSVRYFQITTDPETLPPETTWDLMTNQPGKIERTVGNTFGLRTWLEYGFKHVKDDLGWADHRVTDYAAIDRWWELVMSAYTLVSLQSADFAALGHLAPAPDASSETSQASAPDAPPGARSPFRLGQGQRLEAPPQQPTAAPAALRLFLPAAALARSGPAPARAGRSDRPRRAQLLGQYLRLGSPDMTEEGLRGSSKGVTYSSRPSQVWARESDRGVPLAGRPSRRRWWRRR